jgi:VWFA-related protein
MSYFNFPRLLVTIFLSVLAFCGCALGQQGNSDPFNGGSSAGATGLRPSNSPDSESVSNRGDEGKVIEFKSQTSLVQVPAVVTDPTGKHIHGLTKADFKVLENGKAQNIASLEEIIPVPGVLPAPVKPARTFTNLPTEDGKARLITVLVLDELNTPFLSQANARAQLAKYLASHLDASQALGLLVIGRKGITVLSQLNSDPAQLIASLKKAGGELSRMEQFSNDAQAIAALGDMPSSLLRGSSAGESPELFFRRFELKQDAMEASYTQAQSIESTLRAFLAIAWSLSGVPGRKSLIWITGSFPFYLDSYTSVPGDGSLRVLYDRVLKALNDAQIAVYPLDARGLLGDPAFSAENAGSLLGAEAPALLRQSTQNSMKTFAEMTGGIAYYNTNDLAGAFGRAVEDSSAYYLLSYYLDHRNNRAGWRKLRVQVSSKDAVVRSRAGYLVSDVAMNPELTHKADVDFALASPFESTGIPITQHWQGTVADGAKRKMGFVLNVPAAELIDEADKNRIDVEFTAQATSSKGVVARTVTQTNKGIIIPETLAKLKAEGVLYGNFLDLAPGDYQVRFIVRNNLNGKIGSLIVPLSVN